MPASVASGTHCIFLQISGPDICRVILCNEAYSFYITARGTYN